MMMPLNSSFSLALTGRQDILGVPQPRAAASLYRTSQFVMAFYQQMEQMSADETVAQLSLFCVVRLFVA